MVQLYKEYEYSYLTIAGLIGRPPSTVAYYIRQRVPPEQRRGNGRPFSYYAARQT